jgi:D-alanine-D-alanine ligase
MEKGNRTRLGIIFGGRSGEHEISIRSASAVISALDDKLFDIVPMMISKSGKWLSPRESFEALNPQAQRCLRIDTDWNQIGLPGLLGSGEEISSRIDVYFPILHGTFGEDGTIQGLFELADVPYIGCGVLSSACAMDKVVMKELFIKHGLPVCKYVWFLREQWESDSRPQALRVETEIGFPCFVKPANLGSSVGVSRAANGEELARAVELASRYDRKIVVEECLEMREIECGILGNANPEASLPGEYIVKEPSKSFLDYEEKYAGTGNNEFVVPSPISSELAEAIRSLAKTAFMAVDGAGLSRVDFFLTNDGKLLVNEINTMPGLTDSSGFPKMWAESGRTMNDVVVRLVELALERYADKRRNKTTL